MRWAAAAPTGIWRQALGSGRSDSFEAGVYAKTHWGAAYLSGALGFANHWFTTNRIAVGDQLTASFQGQSYAARGEAGYRYAVPVTGYIIGVTPYAALQVQDFHTPGYSETDLTGGGFGLTYCVDERDRYPQRARRALRQSARSGTACRSSCAAAWPGRMTG